MKIFLIGLFGILTMSAWSQDVSYSQGGLTIYAQSDNAIGGEPISKLIDGSPLTKWLDKSNTSWVMFVYPEPVLWNKYDIVSGNDSPGRDPADWTLYGSNDSVNWVTLDVRYGEVWDSRNVSYPYSFSNATAYKYYKWDITANGGEPLIQVSEFTFFSLTAKGENAPDIAGNLTDANKNTNWVDNSTSSWVSFSYFPGTVWNKYEVTSAGTSSEKDPKDWKLKGSSNGSDWTTIDTQSGQTFTQRLQTKSYLFKNSSNYRFYKWEITANNGSTESIQVAEFKLSYIPRFNIYAQGETAPENLISKLVDQSLHTDWIDDAPSSWVVFSYWEPHVWNKYEVSVGFGEATNDPYDWKISGSNDSINWVILDNQTEQFFDLRKTAYPFAFPNTTSYKYYKWDITANSGGSMVNVAEFLFLGDETTTVKTVKAESIVNVYPNPVANVLNTTGIVDGISIYSIEGVLITTAAKVDKIDVSTLETGAYIAKISINGFIENKIIIKK